MMMRNFNLKEVTERQLMLMFLSGAADFEDIKEWHAVNKTGELK